MAISAKPVNFNELFATTSIPPILVNDYNVDTQEDREKLNDQIYSHYEGDSLKILPSCQCGDTTGEYNVGIVCTNCGTTVMSVTERPLESVLWIAPPRGVSTFINPIIWTILSEYLSYPNAHLLRWLTDPTYALTANPPKQARKLQMIEMLTITDSAGRVRQQIPFERGIDFFYQHFDLIFHMLLENKILLGNRQQIKDLVDFVHTYRECIFANYLPIPSKLGFITEKTITGSFADPTMVPAIDAVRTISATENSATPMSDKVVQARTIKANMLLADYYQAFIATSLGGKYGWFRKHVFGSRLHFTFRAVISSLSDNHEYDELHLPWALSTMVFKVHLTAKLIRRGYTPNQCTKFLHEHALKYHPLLDELFQELIAESPGGGFPVLFNRNPSLARLSIQHMRVTKIKTDPTINSISFSVLALKGPNSFVPSTGDGSRKISLIAGNSLRDNPQRSLWQQRNVQRLRLDRL